MSCRDTGWLPHPGSQRGAESVRGSGRQLAPPPAELVSVPQKQQRQRLTPGGARDPRVGPREGPSISYRRGRPHSKINPGTSQTSVNLRQQQRKALDLEKSLQPSNPLISVFLSSK